MFAIGLGAVVGSACAYAGYNYKMILERLESIGTRRVEVARHSFTPATVQHYVEQRQDGDRLVVYSKYHKCELATH